MGGGETGAMNSVDSQCIFATMKLYYVSLRQHAISCFFYCVDLTRLSISIPLKQDTMGEFALHEHVGGHQNAMQAAVESASWLPEDGQSCKVLGCQHGCGSGENHCKQLTTLQAVAGKTAA